MGTWKHTLNGFAEIFADNPEDNAAKARLITRKLDRFQGQQGEDRELEGIIEEFNIYTNDDGDDYFARIMEGLYDWADRVRVWIEPHKVEPAREGSNVRRVT